MSDINVRMSLVDNISPQIRNISNSVKSAQTQMSSTGKALDEAFTSTAPSAFASDVGSAMSSAATSAEGFGGTMDSVFSGIDGYADEASSAFTSVSGEIENLSNSATGASGEMDSLGGSASDAAEAVGDVSDAADNLGSSVGKVGDGADGFEELGDEADKAGDSMADAEGKAISLSSALQTLFGVISAASALSAVGSYASEAIELGTDYTSTISEVAAISGADESDMAILESTAREYGASTVFSASEAAEALKYMSLAGWDANQSVDALGGVLDLAAASGMGLGEASDMVTDYLSAFSMSADQAGYFSDMLAYAQSNSNTTVAQLGEAFQNSAANMNAYGQDVETTTSILEAMANQGYKGARAGTSLAAIMRDITNNMDDGTIAIGDNIVAVQDEAGNFRDLTDILGDVEAATDGMGDVEKAQALSATFTSDSIKGMNMILAEGVDTISGYEDELRNSAGTASDMADTMTDNLAGDKSELNSAFQELQLQTFESMEEPLRSWTQYLTDTIVPILTDWVPDAFNSFATNISAVGDALKPLIETVLSNPDAIAGAFGSIAAGFAAMKAVNTGLSVAKNVSSAGGIISSLSDFSKKLFGSPWAAGAAAVVAAVGLIATAIDKYNKLTISNNLDEHFGDVELTAEQAAEAASQILDLQYLANVELALNQISNAEEFESAASAALEDNAALEWKARIGLELTPDELTTYSDNIDSYIQNSLDELESRAYAASISVDLFLGNTEEGSSLADAISEWTTADELEFNELSAELSSAVEEALSDGILSVDESQYISELQSKINDITARWKEAEAEAELDWINQEYGTLSGSDLTADSFTAVIDALSEQRETADEETEALAKEFYATVNAAEAEGRLGPENGLLTADEYKSLAGEAIRNQEASNLMTSLEFESNTLSDTYGDKINENTQAMASGVSDYMQRMDAALELANSGDTAYADTLKQMINSGASEINPGNGKTLGMVTDSDQAALNDIYQSMKPDMDAMTELVDEYVTTGQEIPSQIMDQFNQQMEIAAAAGDSDAAWQVFANSIAESGDDAMIDAITEMDAAGELSDGFSSAWARATAEVTDEPVELSGMTAELSDLSVDSTNAGEAIEEAMAALEEAGDTVEVQGTDLEVTLGEVSVDDGDALEKVADAVGMTLEELQGAAGLDTDTEIEAGMTISIPMDQIDVDTTDVAEATQEAVGDEGETIEAEAGAEVTVEAEEVDTTDVTEAAQEAVSGGEETFEVEEQANVIVEAGNVETEAAVQEAESAVDTAFAVTYETSGSANITYSETNNASEVYSKAGSELQSAFNSPYSVHATANITISWHITNPTTSVNLSTSGTTVTASLGHASGGIFDTPHYAFVAEAGPEAIIPLDGSANALDLWTQAGSMLGLLDDGPVSISPPTGENAGESNGEGTAKSSNRTVDININGNASITAGGGISKDDVVDLLMEQCRDVFVQIVEEEALVGGDSSYEY